MWEPCVRVAFCQHFLFRRARITAITEQDSGVKYRIRVYAWLNRKACRTKVAFFKKILSNFSSHRSPGSRSAVSDLEKFHMIGILRKCRFGLVKISYDRYIDAPYDSHIDFRTLRNGAEMII